MSTAASITIVVRMMNSRGEPSTADFVDGPNHSGTWRKAYAIARPTGRKIKKSNPAPGYYFLDCFDAVAS